MRSLPLVGAALFAAGRAETVTPVEKVVTLLTDLKAKVEQEGKDEAATYDTFACFCKDTTKTKADAITSGRDTIDGLAADIEADTAKKVEDETDLLKRKKRQNEMATELEEEQVRCQKEQAEFDAVIADLTGAINAMDKAIGALTAAKSSFLQRDDVLKQVAESLNLAQVLGFGKEHMAVLTQLQKVDPSDPAYKFQSNEILKTLKDMKTDFTDKRTDEEDDRKKAKDACDGIINGLNTEMGTNKDAMDQLDTDIAAAQKKIAGDRKSLVEAEAQLQDDQDYMKDLTERCEARAKDWDQRSAARDDEIKALAEALKILTEGKDGGKSIQDLDKVNKRALVQKLQQVAKVAPVTAVVRAHSFIQAGATITKVGSQRDEAVEFIHREGERLRSQLLVTLSSKLGKDPFVEVKGLIQKLIQRLLDEATQEATKKGFCDTEVGKAEKDRDFRFEDIQKLSAELTSLDAKKDELDESITELKDAIPKLYTELNETTTQRGTEKEENLKSIATAKEGVTAVAEAITILKAYYKDAAKAKVLLQASPVDEDTDGAGFKGAYKGKQEASKGIIGILQVIHSDFDRTARQTSQAEKDAQAEFVKFDRTMREDISAKEMTLELHEQEFESVKNAIEKKTGDLTTAQNLLDDALKTIENLKPMCIDTGMTAAERAQKRQDEIDALKKALTILAPA